ncbi:Ig-like domain-containing protein [Gorillibacterium massiliense]|uniref:Ig-like domain-containing protein n=1 Tax=Gorillibacterium massiliense TaxID=1280390 RepID=UPI000693492F|nr:Ig-like domain-containing protein [Gorillibacterium massiliense]
MKQIRTVRNLMLAVLVLIWASASTLTAFASTSSSSDVLKKLTLSTNEVTLAVGDSKSLYAYGIYGDESTDDLTYYADWNSENTSIASVYNGTITAKAEGTVTMVASYDGFSQSITVKVTKKVKALTKDKQSIELRKDETAAITLTATYSDNTTESVSKEADWSSSDESIATVVNGVVMGAGSGTATITGTYGGKSVTVSVNVDVAKRITASSTEVSLLQKESQKITLNATYADGSVEEVTTAAKWTSSNEEVADVLSGVITGYSAGTATITATYGTKTTTISVTVDKTQKLTVNVQDVFLHENKSQQLTLTAVYPNGTSNDVTSSATWSSSNESVAFVTKGLINGLSSGTATITGTYGGKTVTVKVNVEIVNFLDSSDNELAMSVNDKNTPTLKATYIDGSTEDVTSKATWTSSNQTVAIASKGTITAYKAGTATISATYGGKTVTITVSVDVPTKIITTAKEINIQINNTYYADVIAVFADGSEKAVSESATWTSDDPSIVTVNSKGVLTGVAYGTATVTAAYADKSISITVHVENVRRLTPSSQEVALLVNDKETITLLATYTDGTQKDVSSDATWSSSDESVVYVTKGNLTGLKAGTATIKATYANQTATISIDVDQTKKLKADHQELYLKTDETYNVTVTAVYPDGTTTNVTSSATWSSSDPAIASVYKGTITAEAAGTATIKATYSNKSVNITVGVNIANHLDANKDELAMHTGGSEKIKLTATYADGSTEDVTSMASWSSDNDNAVLVSKGTITAYKMGKATVSASYGGKKVTVQVSVDIPSKVYASNSEVKLNKIGDEETVTIFAKYKDGTVANVSSDVEWSTKDKSIAEVLDGVITGIATGSTTVTAKYNDEKINITVKVGLTGSLEANVPLVTIGVSDTYQIVLTATDDNGNETNVTDKAEWKISKATVASVKKGLVTGYSKGTATITATYGGQSTQVSVEVDQVSRIVASVPSASLKSGETAKLTVTVYFSNGKSKDVTSLAEWTTSNYKIATVSTSGVVKAVASGKANISAKYAGKTAKVAVDVDMLKYLETSSMNVSLKVGGTLQVSATATYLDSSEADVTKRALWTSSKPDTATVKDGLIKATGAGKANVTVEFGDKKVKLNITVTEK